MAEPMMVSFDQIIQVLLQSGFSQPPRKGKGNHKAFYKKNEKGQITLVIVPKFEKIPSGVLKAILEQANLSLEKFQNLSKSP